MLPKVSNISIEKEEAEYRGSMLEMLMDGCNCTVLKQYTCTPLEQWRTALEVRRRLGGLEGGSELLGGSTVDTV